MSNRHYPLIGACLASALLLCQVPDADAQARKARAGAKTSVNAAVARPAPATSVQRPATQRPVPPRQPGGVHVNQNNQNINNNINVNVQGNQHGGHGYPPPPSYDHDHDHGHDHDWDDWDDWDHHPFAVASAVTAGVAVTNAVIGSIVRTVPPQCVPVIVNGISYQQCGSTWYQPQYVGTSVQYVVVVPPG